MGKISPVTNKYTIIASFKSYGTVEKPDIIGAVFGQTEGLLGNDLELRELQKSGRIGRIDVDFKKTSKSFVEGEIIIPSSLNQAETALIAAAIETITRVGPADADIRVIKIEDVRVSKRKYVLNRAKELLKELVESTMPDSKEISDEVFKSVRTMEVIDFGEDKLSAGPGIKDSEEVILVEGRADVINLLRYGFRNVISMNGSHVPKTIIDLSKQKEMTVFIDGDRGGELIVSELRKFSEVDFVAIAPMGKEVEELAGKEIHKALRAKVPIAEVTFNSKNNHNGYGKRGDYRKYPSSNNKFSNNNGKYEKRPAKTYEKQAPVKKAVKPTRVSAKNMSSLKKYGEDLLGSGGAYILDGSFSLLGKVPVSELINSLKELDDVSSVVIDVELTEDMAKNLFNQGVGLIVCNKSATKFNGVKILLFKNL